jgi:hypothetical protein
LTPSSGGSRVVPLAAALLAIAQEFARAVVEPASQPDTVDPASGTSDEAARAVGLHTVASARVLRRVADDALAAAVADARDQGATWAELGAVLGTSRQAAFQRFAQTRESGTGLPSVAVPLPGAAGAALEVLAAFFAGDLARVRRDFTVAMAELDEQRLVAVRRQLAGTVGPWESLGEPFVRRNGVLTVVDVPVRCAAGELTGRVAFTDAGGVTGLFFLTDPID